MKASEVLKILRITRQTLSKYVKEGIIKVNVLPTGRYDYDRDSVYAFINKNAKRKTCIYARVLKSKSKDELNDQIELIKQFCFSNGYTVSSVYSDIGSGLDFSNRPGLESMLDEIVNNKIERVVVAYKDRLARTGFDLMNYLFKEYNCELIVMSEIGSEKQDSDEIKDDITNFMSNYTEKYSNKNTVNKIKEILKD